MTTLDAQIDAVRMMQKDIADALSGCKGAPEDEAYFEELHEKLTAALATLEAARWRPIAEANKGPMCSGDMVPVWVKLRDDLVEYTGRQDLAHWAGLQLPMRHPGLPDDGFDIGWSIHAPVGQGGFPDDWIIGWKPMPEPAPPEVTP